MRNSRDIPEALLNAPSVLVQQRFRGSVTASIPLPNHLISATAFYSQLGRMPCAS